MQHWAPPQYSPDGRWWWNGQRWVPVTWPVAPQPDPDWARDQWPYDQTFRAARRRRTPAVFWVGLLALIVLLVLAAGGGALSWVTQRGQGLGLGTAPAPTAPTQPPAGPTPDGVAPSTVDEYRQAVAADAGQFQDAVRTVGDRCAPDALGSGIGGCQAALQALDDAVQRFQSDLDAHPAPTCLQPVDRELRTALALYHQGVQQELDGLQRGDVVAAARGAGTLGEATGHARTAGSLLQSAC
jgi:hypothetical protein